MIFHYHPLYICIRSIICHLLKLLYVLKQKFRLFLIGICFIYTELFAFRVFIQYRKKHFQWKSILAFKIEIVFDFRYKFPFKIEARTSQSTLLFFYLAINGTSILSVNIDWKSFLKKVLCEAVTVCAIKAICFNFISHTILNPLISDAVIMDWIGMQNSSN